MVMRKILIVATAVLAAMIFTSCEKEEVTCERVVEHFTRVKGSDVIKLVETSIMESKPMDYVQDGVEHIFLYAGGCN